MHLVELETDNGQKVWVNPAHIVLLRSTTGSGDRVTDLTLVIGDKVHIKGNPSSIAAILNKAFTQAP